MLAEERNDLAIAMVAELYAQGRGVPKNDEMVVEWLQKGASWHLPKSLWLLGIQYSKGGHGLVKDEAKAINLLRESADLGCPDAMVALGNRYSWGDVRLERSDEKALVLYRKAANLNNAEAMYLIGCSYALGVKHVPDNGEAAKWYKKAMDSGYSKAYYAYGDCLGHLNRSEEAVETFKKGADLGLSDCMAGLGYMWEAGIHGKHISRKQAVYWYRKAAQLGDENAAAALKRLGY